MGEITAPLPKPFCCASQSMLFPPWLSNSPFPLGLLPHTLPLSLMLLLSHPSAHSSFCPFPSFSVSALFVPSFLHFLSCLIHGGLKAEAKAPSSLTRLLYDSPKYLHFVPSFLNSVSTFAAPRKISSASLSPHCLPLRTLTLFYSLTG